MYNLVIYLYLLGVAVYSLFNEKVRKMPEQIIDAAANFLEEQANNGKEETK